MENIILTPLELAGRLALALALAVFLGLTFEEIYKRNEPTVPGGVRTFPMLAMMGAALYLIEPRQALAFIAGLFALAIWLHAYLRGVSAHAAAPSLIIPAANMLAYLIGPVGLTQPPWMVVAISVIAVLLLGAREPLHRLIEAAPLEEVLTASKFLVLVAVILPIVPNQPVTAATPLTPYGVWLAVVAICTLSYASYLFQTYVPARKGALLPAILGGIYSSTITTIVLSKRQQEAGGVHSDFAAGILAATAVMYLRLGIMVAIFDARLALALAPALAALFFIGAVMAAFEWRRTPERSDTSLAVPVVNPLQITTAITFAAIFIVVSLASAWARTAFGQQGVFALSVVVGVTDIDPFVLSVAQGGVSAMSAGQLSAAIVMAASSNNLAKAGYALGFGSRQFSRRPAAMLLILAVLGFAVAALYLSAAA